MSVLRSRALNPARAPSVMTYTAAGQLYFSQAPAIAWVPGGNWTSEATWNWYDGSGLRVLGQEGTMNGYYPLVDSSSTRGWTAYIYDGGQLVLTVDHGDTTWSVSRRQLSAGIDRPLVLKIGGRPVALLAVGATEAVEAVGTVEEEGVRSRVVAASSSRRPPPSLP